MHKLVNSYIAAVLLGLFTLSAVVCCCVGRMAQAHATAKSSPHSCCHSQPGSQDKNSKACDDCSHKGMISEAAPSTFDLNLSAQVKSRIVADIILPRPETMSVPMPINGINGPPAPGISLPLFLQFSILRL